MFACDRWHTFNLVFINFPLSPSFYSISSTRNSTRHNSTKQINRSVNFHNFSANYKCQKNKRHFFGVVERLPWNKKPMSTKKTNEKKWTNQRLKSYIKSIEFETETISLEASSLHRAVMRVCLNTQRNQKILFQAHICIHSCEYIFCSLVCQHNGTVYFFSSLSIANVAVVLQIIHSDHVFKSISLI